MQGKLGFGDFRLSLSLSLTHTRKWSDSRLLTDIYVINSIQVSLSPSKSLVNLLPCKRWPSTASGRHQIVFIQKWFQRRKWKTKFNRLVSNLNWDFTIILDHLVNRLIRLDTEWYKMLYSCAPLNYSQLISCVRLWSAHGKGVVKSDYKAKEIKNKSENKRTGAARNCLVYLLFHYLSHLTPLNS